MKSQRTLSRREVMVLLGGAVVTISACGGGSSSPAAPTPSSSGDKVGQISNNHDHVAVITSGQLQLGGALLLPIRGTATHPHNVELGASEIVQIRDGGRVSKTSSNDDGHTHQVTFN